MAEGSDRVSVRNDKIATAESAEAGVSMIATSCVTVDVPVSVPVAVAHVGELCDELSVREDLLKKITNDREIEWTKLSSVFLVNGVVFELCKWLKKYKYHVSVIFKIITILFDVEIAEGERRVLQRRVKRVCETEQKMRKRKSKKAKEELSVYQRGIFNLQVQGPGMPQQVQSQSGESTHAERMGMGEVERMETAGVEETLSVETGEGEMEETRWEGRMDERAFSVELESLRAEKDRLVGKLESARQELKRLGRELDEVRTKYRSEVARVHVFQRELKKLKKECLQSKEKGERMADALRKSDLGCTNAKKQMRKFYRQKRRREKKIRSLEEDLEESRKLLYSQILVKGRSHDEGELQKLRQELEDVRNIKDKLENETKKQKEEVVKLTNRIVKLRVQKRRIQKRGCSRISVEEDRKRRALEENQRKSSLIVSLRKEIRELKDELLEVQSEEPSEPFTCSFKHGRTYNSNVRGVYQDLLTNYGVSAGNCEGVVRTVLEGLTDIDMKNVSLPKKTTAANMFLEGRKIAYVQVARSLAEESDMTLSSDATTKFGHHYSAFDIYKESDGSSSSMMIGMRESVGGTAQTTLDTLIGILNEVTNMPGSSQTVNKVIANIKNTMSDRHVAEKKFNELIRDYREGILPEIIDKWEAMNGEEKERFTTMNNFFCALHYVVGLADYASKAIQAWEKMIFGEDRVGAQSLSGLHVESSESGTVRLVRTVCKAVQDRGCERSGKPLEFRTFLRSKGIKSVPLASFKGNRFNILFKNSAGVFFLATELKEFFKEHDENDLLKAARADLSVNQYLAAVRALGLIDKLVTAPLWRVINESGHITEMNRHYADLHVCFSRWADDASQFMCGNDVLFEGEHNPADPIFMSLVTPNAVLDQMTKQVLELVFLAFCQVTERMLEDHLGSGKYTKMGEEQVRETKSVPRTNVGVERDFGMLDRIVRLKPSASMLVYESIVMGVRNKTSEWRKGLSVSDREELMEYARKSVKVQRDEYARRVKQLWEERAAKRKNEQEKVKEREERKRVKREKMYADVVSKCGGIWMSEGEVNEKMKGANEKKCVEMLQAQLQARRYMFHEKDEKSRKKSMQELRESLLAVIREANERGNRVKDTEEAEYANACASEDKVTEYRMQMQEKRRKRKSPGKKRHRMGRQVKYEDLVGKIVEHLTAGEDGEEGWHRGIVISSWRKGLRLCYDYKPGTTYEYTREEIEEDLQNRDLKVAELTVEDIIGRHIMHRFEVDDDLVWFKGFISSATKNQGCLVIYEQVEDEEGGDLENSWEGPLLEDYANNNVRFVLPK